MQWLLSGSGWCVFAPAREFSPGDLAQARHLLVSVRWSRWWWLRSSCRGRGVVVVVANGDGGVVVGSDGVSVGGDGSYGGVVVVVFGFGGGVEVDGVSCCSRRGWW